MNLKVCVPCVMKKLPAFSLLTLLLSGCGTWTSYHQRSVAGPPTTAKYPIPVYMPDREPPRPCITLADISINHTELTITGGSISDEMQKVMKKAHAKGADAVQIVEVQKPDFENADYSVQAKLLRYADIWEKSPLSERDFRDYLRKNRANLDPIEGIWSDGLPHRLGIIRDSTMPGRDFIAFTITPDLPSWQPGYKKMDVARATAPRSYEIKYYRDDFSWSDVIVSLDDNRHFQFSLHSGEEAFPIDFTKLVPALPRK
jgi:hypothetical protein